MSDVVISSLVKTYPGSTERATDDISLEIADGEFMVLLGPSGCGKTTLLRMIAGLELPDDGSIAIGSRDVTYLPAHKRGLSMVFQSYAVFPHRTVRDNIAFGLVTAKKDRAEVDRKVEWAADLLQLASGMSPRAPPVGLVRLRQRAVGEHHDDRVQLGVDLVDPAQVRFHDLARGRLPRADQLGQFEGAAAPQLVSHVL
jgi:ABC-type Fe3+/spermidine/putrescine transport system ATPase subunit